MCASLNKTFPSFIPFSGSRKYIALLGVPSSTISHWWRLGTILFNDALDTFYLQLYGVVYIYGKEPLSARENPLPPLYVVILAAMDPLDGPSSDAI